MPDIIEPILFDVDLARRKVVRRLRGGLSVGDRSAAKVILKCTQDGKEVDLTGVTAYGRFFRQGDGAEIRLNDDTINKDTVTVALIDECFAAAGYFELDVVVVFGDVHRTLVTLSGEVHTGGSGELVDIDGVVPSLDDILAQYATMQQVTQDATAAKNAANTAASNADAKATAAQTAADAANAAAERWDASDSAKLGGKPPEHYLQPLNLLDNSDFRNPVNQRGAGGSYEEWGGYIIDRWEVFADGATVNMTNQGLSLYKSIFQPIGADTMLRYNGKHLTYAVKIDGVVYAASGLFEQTGAWHVIQRIETPYGHILFEAEDNDYLFCIINNNISAATIEWASLYEGSYTAETLPPYMPKGYAVELTECQRRYHVYETESARPSKPLDCCPPMTLAPGTIAMSQGILTVEGKTLFYNSTDL